MLRVPGVTLRLPKTIVGDTPRGGDCQPVRGLKWDTDDQSEARVTISSQISNGQDNGWWHLTMRAHGGRDHNNGSWWPVNVNRFKITVCLEGSLHSWPHCTESPQTNVNITPAVGTHRGQLLMLKLCILKSKGFFDLIFCSDSSLTVYHVAKLRNKWSLKPQLYTVQHPWGVGRKSSFIWSQNGA